MSIPARKPASYEDVLNAPSNQIAQVMEGSLHLQPRPSGPHQHVSTVLGQELGSPFQRGRNGPGGWLFLDEPELHFGSDILVPDLAAWRRERLPYVPDAPFLTVAPDWICEVLSPSTASIDRVRKLPIYAREQVSHAWLIDPAARTLEIFRREAERWTLLSAHQADEVVQGEPFEAFALDLKLLYADLDPR